MKSRITILLALLLALVCIAASAQEYYTLSEIREQAAQGWHETYLAYGREIVADVDVNMPDVDVLPIDKIELARLFPSSDNGNGGIKITARPDENIFAFDSMAYLAIPEHVIWKYERQYAPPYDLRKIYAENSSLCLGDAIETIRNALAEVELDASDWLLERPYELYVSGLWNQAMSKREYPGCYSLKFYQVLNGIPILNHAGCAYYEKTRGNYTAMLDAWVIDEDTVHVYVAMLKAVDRIAEDVPLCSFDRVIRAYEEEIKEGHIRKIYDLEFGYVFYDDPKYVSGEGFAEHYYAVPAWRLNCLYMSNRQKELPEYNTEESTEERDSLEYAALVVNAQTGEMLNFMSKDKNRAHYKGFISWNDVK